MKDDQEKASNKCWNRIIKDSAHMIRIVHLIKSILNENSLTMMTTRMIKADACIFVLAVWFHQSFARFLHFSIQKNTKGNSNISWSFFIIVVAFFCICSPTGHINIFEYYVSILRTKANKKKKKDENITSTHGQRKQIRISYFVRICKGGKWRNNKKKVFLRWRKKTFYHMLFYADHRDFEDFLSGKNRNDVFRHKSCINCCFSEYIHLSKKFPDLFSYRCYTYHITCLFLAAIDNIIL